MKYKYFASGILLCASVAFATAQTTDSTLQSIQLSGTTISANQAPQSRREVVQSVQVLTQKRIAHLNPQTTADLLASLGNVHVQRSQQGGGSPVLRGFEASRILLVVDGVRMNNIVYRAGHLQNIVTIDPAMLQRVEVLMGPASTVYGSDALGGAIVFTTRNPELLQEEGALLCKSNAVVRYSTANQEQTAHYDLNIGGRNWASLTSLSYADFGDLRMGSRAGSVPLWGGRPFYVERINGRDSVVINRDSLVQRQSGYRQVDLLQKFLYKHGRMTHVINLQYSNSTDIPRYDRLTDRNSAGQLRFAEWYYGPQLRALAAYHMDYLPDNQWFDHLRVVVSGQQIQESRHSRNFGNNRRTSRIEDITVVGYNVDIQRDRGAHWWRMGFDGQSNWLTSTAQRLDIVTAAVTSADTRYPDGDNTLHNVAAFVQHRARLAPKWILNDGFRVGYNALNSTFVSREFFQFPYSEATQSSPVWSANLGLIYQPTPHLRLTGGVSTGFRAPNVDDLAKVFETVSNTLIVPNPDLRPEKTITYELGLGGFWGRQSAWETSIFLTDFRNAIVVAPFTFNGQSVVDYNGTPSAVFASQNQDRARVAGIQSQLVWHAHRLVTLYGSVMYTQGTVLARDTFDSFPLDHIPPVVGRAGAEFHTDRLRVEGFCNFNGKKDISDFSPNGEDNLQYATPQGMPAWHTLNLHAGYRVWSGLHLQTGIDNLLDTRYRTFASGIHAPGRNFFVALRWMAQR
jgi:hemoglobin/transferrin/lactoferrin receptor protein